MDEKQKKTLAEVMRDLETKHTQLHSVSVELMVPMRAVFDTLALSKRDRLLVLASIATAIVGTDTDITMDDFYFVAAVGTFRDAAKDDDEDFDT